MYLLVEERQRLFLAGKVTDEIRRAEKEATRGKWIRRWAELENVAQWTKSLIPDLGAWLDCSHKEIDFYITQFLSGHGSFNSYLHRIGKVPDQTCNYCGEEVDNPEHTILRCSRWRKKGKKYLHGM